MAQLPQFTANVGQSVFLEPLNAPSQLSHYLERFPEALYTRAPDSHFMRFMYALLGPSGVGWLKKAYLDARLEIEASGAAQTALDAFYSDPFAFGRLLDEISDSDPSGLLTGAEWDSLRGNDASYRSRALQFLKAAGQGTTPLGMKLAASSGLGHSVSVYENYQRLFDGHCDIPLGLPRYGRSQALGEFTIVPRLSISRTEQQIIDFADASEALGAYDFFLSYGGYNTGALASTSDAGTIQLALSALPLIGPGNVLVTGGPAPTSFVITFTGTLSGQPLPTISAYFIDTFTRTITIPVIVTTGAIDPSSETVVIGPADQRSMQIAIDRLRPVASYPSYAPAPGVLASREWSGLLASSEYTKVVRFVTGSAAIAWPLPDSTHWIQPSIELEAPQLEAGLRAHYVAFHNLASAQAYTDAALSDPNYLTDLTILPRYISTHAGPFPEMKGVMSFFDQFRSLALQFPADAVLADYPDPITVTAVTGPGLSVLNDVYPIDYLSAQGAPQLTYRDAAFWASAERATGTDYLEIDLGSPQAVNYISFETSRKPLDITFAYDTLDQSPSRNFVDGVALGDFPISTSIYITPALQNPWEPIIFYFDDGVGMVYTRYVRLAFTRRPQPAGGFLYPLGAKAPTPYTIDVRNLRIGRNIAPGPYSPSIIVRTGYPHHSLLPASTVLPGS